MKPWQPIPLNTRWSSISPASVLIYTDDEAIIADVRRRYDSLYRLRLQTMEQKRVEKDIREKVTLSDSTSGLMEAPRGARAVMLPSTTWSTDGLLAPRNLVAILVGALVMAVILWTADAGMAYMAYMAGIGTSVGIRQWWKGNNTVEIIARDSLGLNMDTVHAYALSLEQGVLWVPPNVGGDRRKLAFERVATIQSAYLALREDIVERIERPALFDPAVPATAEFEAALVAFQDVTQDTPTERVDELASEVEVTFNVAQANAERLGLAHLPEDVRDDARRAAKAARLAQGATTEGERVASLHQVKRILDSLALYYLPTLNERLSIEAPQGQH